MMNMLYTSGYKKRFDGIIRILKEYKPKQVLELCFGDVLIAEFCKSNAIEWHGFDSNAYFVRQAKLKGFNADGVDLLSIAKLPEADICIMIGSLYHFHEDIHNTLDKILKSSTKIIISEPIKNLSDQKNFIGWFARKSANAGKGDEQFRYNENSFKEMLREESVKLNFTFTVVGYYKKDIIAVLEKNGNKG